MIPSDIRYIHERAKAYQMIDDHERAVDDFSLVIKKNPRNAHAHFRRAFSFKALKVRLQILINKRTIQKLQKILKKQRN
jgi:hypothetical protein